MPPGLSQGETISKEPGMTVSCKGLHSIFALLNMGTFSYCELFYWYTCSWSLCWSHSGGCTGSGAGKYSGWPIRSFLAVASLIQPSQKPAMTGKKSHSFLISALRIRSVRGKVNWWGYTEQHPTPRLFTLLYCYLTQFTEVDDTLQTSTKCSLLP